MNVHHIELVQSIFCLKFYKAGDLKKKKYETTDSCQSGELQKREGGNVYRGKISLMNIWLAKMGSYQPCFFCSVMASFHP